MGAAPYNLDVIADLHRRGFLPSHGAIADLGCTQLRGATTDDLRRFLACFGTDVAETELMRLAAHDVFLCEHVKAIGFEYRSFDIVKAPDCVYLDLNRDRVPPRWRGKFDLVLNLGTTEHVLNQLNAFTAIHDLVKPQGLIYALFLRGGYMDHGLLHYSDHFVDELSRANRYETIWREDLNEQGRELTWIVLRKVSASGFNLPLDVEERSDLPHLRLRALLHLPARDVLHHLRARVRLRTRLRALLASLRTQPPRS